MRRAFLLLILAGILPLLGKADFCDVIPESVGTCTFTATPTSTPTPTKSPTRTFSHSPTITQTFTVSPTATLTFTITKTFTITPTFTVSPTVTPTFSATKTTSPTPTNTVTNVPSWAPTPKRTVVPNVVAFLNEEIPYLQFRTTPLPATTNIPTPTPVAGSLLVVGERMAYFKAAIAQVQSRITPTALPTPATDTAQNWLNYLRNAVDQARDSIPPVF